MPSASASARTVRPPAARVRWEAAGHGGVFPHVYDEPLEGAIVGEGEVLEWERGEGESWVDAAARLEGLE